MQNSYYEEIQHAINELGNEFNDHKFFIKETEIL